MLTSWKWRTAERRIGIVGLANAGKTVLLTSLIAVENSPIECSLAVGSLCVLIVRLGQETEGSEAAAFVGPLSVKLIGAVARLFSV